MSMYIINDDWIREYERNIEELIGSDLEYDSATNPTPPLRKVDGTRWHELFGTPERAARTLEEFELDQLNWCRGTEYCESCPYEFDRYGCYLPDGFSLFEWLRGDA